MLAQFYIYEMVNKYINTIINKARSIKESVRIKDVRTLCI